jgi:uncharacterized repeat protein (TIGR03803 family)
MAFPILRDPEIIHLFVDKFPNLLNGPTSAITQFYNFCTKSCINELSLYDTLSVLPSQSTKVSNFIFSAKTYHNICEVSGSINPYDPPTLGLKYINLIVNYNNSESGLDRKYDRLTVENEFWNLETSINPLKNTAGYTITTTNGSATATIAGGSPSTIFAVGNMVKVFGVYRQVVSVGATSIIVDRPFTFTLNNSVFEIRNNKVVGDETYAIDFETYLLRLKNIRNVAVANNLKIDAYLSRRVTQTQFLKLIPFIDRILIEADYDQNNYLLYNDPTQLNKVRDVLIRCTQNRTGTVTINSGNNTMVGVGTDFYNELGVGTKIVINGQIFTIASINNFNQATLSETYLGSTLSNVTFKTYVEFAPIYYINKALRKTWLTTPANTKSYADVFKMFTLSGYTVGGSVQSGSSPISYNLEDNPSISGATNLVGLSIFSRSDAESIDLSVTGSSSPRSSCVNPSARLIGTNNTYAVTFQKNDCTCDNAANGSVIVDFSTIQPTPYNYTFTNGNRVIQISNVTTPPPYTFNGLGIGTWNLSVTDGNNSTSTGSITIAETFLPTITGNYISAGQGGITVFYTGGYNNYYISRIDNPTNINNQWGPFVSYHNAGSDPFFDSNITVNNTTKSYNSTSTPAYNFVPNQSYSFVIGDTDACIKISTVTIPQAASGPTVNITQTTNPACNAAANGSITMVAAGTGPYIFNVTYPNGSTNFINSVSTTQVLNNLLAGTYSITVTDANNVTSTPPVTTTLTNTYNSNINATSTLPNQVCFQLVAGFTYTITSGGGSYQTFNQTVSGPNFNPCFNNLPAGQYNFNILSSNGCSETVILTVSNAVLTLSLVSYTNPPCLGINTGTISSLATSTGSGAFTYSAITNGTVYATNNNGNFTGLSAGTWTIGVSQGILQGNTITVPLVNTFYANVTNTGNTICVTTSGGSVGTYCVEINGVLYPYNTLLPQNCYTGSCGNNLIRVIDGDIITGTTSGCSYTTTIDGECAFSYGVTANTVTCGTNGSIIVRATGGEPPYFYTVSGDSVYTNIHGTFSLLELGVWMIIVEDSVGNSGTTIVNLDGTLNFNASSTYTGVCVTISGGQSPYYVLINDTIYTASTSGTYCYELECGYYGINVYDSCPNSVCARYLFTRTAIAPPIPTPFDISWTNCDGVFSAYTINGIGETYETCLIMGSQVTTVGITATLIGFCSESINETCYIDTSEIENVQCLFPLGISYLINEPNCSNTIDGEINVIGVNGYQPYLSYSAVNDSTLFTNNNGIFTGLSAGTWTIYVEDSFNAVTSTTVNLIPNFYTPLFVTDLGLNSLNICVNIPNAYTGQNFNFVFENQNVLLEELSGYCVTLTGVTGCSEVNYSVCNLSSTCCYYGTYDLSEILEQQITNVYGTTVGGQPAIAISISGNNNPNTIYEVVINSQTYSFNKNLNPNFFTAPYYGNNNFLVRKNLIQGYNINSVYSFAFPFANTPNGKLILGSDGNFYGIARNYNLLPGGVIFSSDTLGNFGVIKDLTYSDGALYVPPSFNSLIEVSPGIFYGTFPEGGDYTYGSLFSCDTAGNFQKLHSFGGSSLESKTPYSNLLLASNGIFYGTTIAGGAPGAIGQGTIFSSDTSGNVGIVVKFFSTTSTTRGTNPYGSLIEASNGVLYGTNAYGGIYNGGTIFSCTTSGNFGVIHHFNSLIEGTIPITGLLEASNGIFYGTTQFGGTNNFGTIFSCNTLGNVGTLHNFDGLLGLYPNGELFESPDGFIYGTLTNTLSDLSDFGGIYRITTSGEYELVQYFGFGNGSNPSANSLTLGNDNKIYGITSQGGASSSGAIYELEVLTLTGCSYSATTNIPYCLSAVTISTQWINNIPYICVDINNNSTQPPYEVVVDNITYLYNTSSLTGNCYPVTGCGQINVSVCASEITSQQLSGFTVEHTFSISDAFDGKKPYGNLTLNYDGKLYGMTSQGGVNESIVFAPTGAGVIFSYDVTTKTYQKIYDFDPDSGDGFFPLGTLQCDSNNNLYGVTYLDPLYGYGTLFSCTTSGSHTIIHNFDNVNGSNPITLATKDINTNLFYRAATTLTNTVSPQGGVLYWFDDGSFNFTNPGFYTLYIGSSFGNNPGSLGIKSYGGLLWVRTYIITGFPDALFAGLTSSGGINNYGTIFLQDLTYGIYDVYNFDGINDGGNPRGELTTFPNENQFVYGMTLNGGDSGAGYGTIFKFDLTNPLTSTPIILHTFIGGSDGAYPYGSLTPFNGKLYGMTSSGGTNNSGIIFSINPSQPFPHDYTIIHNFDGSSGGANPQGSLTVGIDGKLYGMTLNGGNGIGGAGKGIIFSFDDNLTPRDQCCTEEIIDLNNPNDIDLPIVEGFWLSGETKICITIDPDNYYPSPYQVIINNTTQYLIDISATTTTCFSGYSCGSFLISTESINTNFNNFLTIYNFTKTGGFNPLGSLLEASNGSFYGMTLDDDTKNLGAIFSCDTLGNFDTLYSFNILIPSDGNSPRGNLIEVPTLKFYGMTPFGGSFSNGVIFSCDTSGIPTTIHEFKPIDGIEPYGSLLLASDGLLYGLTSANGANNGGTIFRMDPINGTSSFQVIYDFDPNVEGFEPRGSLIEPSPGILVGTLSNDNTNNLGSVFAIETNGTNFTFQNFNTQTDGDTPLGSLIEYPLGSGIFWGTTQNGGTNGLGNIFYITINPPTNLTPPIGVFSFNLFNGSLPTGDLLLASDGLLYGMTPQGGAYGFGTIFRFNPISYDFEVIYHLDNQYTGRNPYGNLIQATDGYLYGMTSLGVNIIDRGTIFRMSTSGLTFPCVFTQNNSIPCFYLETLFTYVPCNLTDGIISVLASGNNPNYTYELTNGIDTFTVVSGTSQIVTFNNLTAGTWTLTVTNAFNQVLTETYVLTQMPIQPLQINGYNVLITVGNLLAQFTGVTLDGVVIHSGSVLDNFTFSADCGEHILEITSEVGCDNFVPFEIICPDIVFGQINLESPFCCTEESAVIVVSITGGVGPYLYTLYNLPTTVTYTSTTGSFFSVSPPSGYWQVQVDDQYGSVGISDLIYLTSIFYADIDFVNNNAVIDFSGASGVNVFLNGTSQTGGYINVPISGGTLQYPLSCGTNNIVSITGRLLNDSLNYDYCTISASTYFPCPLTCGNFFIQPRCQGSSASFMTVYITGGTPSYNISLSNGITTYTANTSAGIFTFNGINTPGLNLIEDEWTITIIDSDGSVCLQDITILPTFNVTTTASTTGVCFTITGGNPPYLLTIDGVGSSQYPGYILNNNQVYCVDLPCGNHVLVIQEATYGDDPPCSFTFNFSSPCDLTGTTTFTDPGCNDNCNGSITVSVTGSAIPYNFILTNTNTSVQLSSGFVNQNTYTFYGLCEGNYDVTVFSSAGAYYNDNVTLSSQFSISATGYSILSSCTEGLLCISITGGTAPYDIYIDGILRLSATTQLDNCFSATCGTDHTFLVYDSSPPCIIPVNQQIISDPSFNDTNQWVMSPPTGLGITSFTNTISSGLLTYTFDIGTATTATGTTWLGTIYAFSTRNSGYSWTYQIPLSVRYQITFSAGTISPFIVGPGGSGIGYNNITFLTPFGNKPTFKSFIYSNTQYITNNVVVPTTITSPTLPYSGFGFSFNTTFGQFVNAYNNTTKTFQFDTFSATVLDYTIDCRCYTSGTTLVPCNPPLDIDLISYVQPDCFEGCNGSITVLATGGVQPYSYSATNGTLSYINNTGIFTDLCEGNWDISVVDDCGSGTTLGTFFLENSFFVDILTTPTEFCVTVSGGTPPYTIYLDSVEIDVINQGPATICYSADCGVTTIITVADSSGL